MKYLTDKQSSTIRGMSNYWTEVSKREDKSPLIQELNDVYRMLGTNILWILRDYVKAEKIG